MRTCMSPRYHAPIALIGVSTRASLRTAGRGGEDERKMPSAFNLARREAEVRALEAAYDEAWNRADAEGLAAALSDDAIVVNPRGEVANGRAEFEGIMTRMFSGPFAGSTHESEIARIHFVTADVAVVDGEARVSGVRGESSPITHAFTDVVVRRSGRWVIVALRAYARRSAEPSSR
jgi:uncharacterized protein (TIGR02246 family)